MTIRMILSAMLRRWYIPLGVLICLGLLTVMLMRDGGTYTTTTVVSFMRPASTSLSPTNGANDSSVIAFAGAVVQEANNGRPPARYSMEEAPYYGAGMRQGVLIELANSGNQWVSTFEKAEIEIRIVGRSRDWVESRQTEAVNRVLDLAEAQQARITPTSRIAASVIPLTMQIGYVSASRSAQAAAVGAMLAVALIVGAWSSIRVDSLLSGRGARQRAASSRSFHRAQGGATP